MFPVVSANSAGSTFSIFILRAASQYRQYPPAKQHQRDICLIFLNDFRLDFCKLTRIFSWEKNLRFTVMEAESGYSMYQVYVLYHFISLFPPVPPSICFVVT